MGNPPPPHRVEDPDAGALTSHPAGTVAVVLKVAHPSPPTEWQRQHKTAYTEYTGACVTVGRLGCRRWQPPEFSLTPHGPTKFMQGIFGLLFPFFTAVDNLHNALSAYVRWYLLQLLPQHFFWYLIFFHDHFPKIMSSERCDHMPTISPSLPHLFTSNSTSSST